MCMTHGWEARRTGSLRTTIYIRALPRDLEGGCLKQGARNTRIHTLQKPRLCSAPLSHRAKEEELQSLPHILAIV